MEALQRGPHLLWLAKICLPNGRQNAKSLPEGRSGEARRCQGGEGWRLEDGEARGASTIDGCFAQSLAQAQGKGCIAIPLVEMQWKGKKNKHDFEKELDEHLLASETGET